MERKLVGRVGMPGAKYDQEGFMLAMFQWANSLTTVANEPFILPIKVPNKQWE